MRIITKKEETEKAFSKSVKIFFAKYKVGAHLKTANAYKKQGVSVIAIVEYLLILVFSQKSMYMNILNGSNTVSFGKDVVYRFLNATFINWTSFLLKLAMSVISEIEPLTDKKRINAIIVDDTMYGRERSKHVELLAKVYDHGSKPAAYKRGFRMLTAAWSDGVSLIPLAFRHLSSSDKKKRYNEIDSRIDKRSVGYRTRKEAIQGAPEVLLTMLKQFAKIGVPSKHVLFDSWFSSPKAIIDIFNLHFFVVARLKDTKKIKYFYKGEKKTLKEIYASNNKRRGKSKYLLSVEVELYNSDEQIVPAKIVYVRNRSNRKKWIALISTDMGLNEEEIVQLYGKRWDIEVFFKMCKSYLNLGKEFQGLSYDCITAHTTIVMMRYIMLETQKRQNLDMRTFGELFFLCYDEIADINFAKALSTIMEVLRGVLSDCLFLSKEQISEIISVFIFKLPSHFKTFFENEMVS